MSKPNNTKPFKDSSINAINKSSSNKFDQMQHKHTEHAKKMLNEYDSSSEDDLDEQNILDSLYKNYNVNSFDQAILPKTSTFLESAIQAGASTCLICIGRVRHSDAIWSCHHCYCFFHLNCIKRWATDSIFQAIEKSNQQNNNGYYNNLGVYIVQKKKLVKWYCPQCRQDFEPNERPNQYQCFCGKEENPTQQPWLIPHSCGEICEKGLRPACGHKCLLLCHPGPCPPCPQNVFISCKCNKSVPKSVRCFQKSWMCKEKCLKMLPCLKHQCQEQCHEEDKCPPCDRTSKKKCICQSEESMRNCIEQTWQCKKVCNRIYQCGIHNCKKICHDGLCGDCPLGLPRSCPCGKSKKTGPCNEVIESCGDTCQKPLPCNLHYCTQRCHKGVCSLCLIIVKKRCRCGKHTKELPCWKTFTCETKCKQVRECGKHPCNKKCCDGQCSPCDKICGKSLTCKKHKCKSICHDGPCYPCNQTSQINCRCGRTTKIVPCGREKTRVTCNEPCRLPSKCQHKNQHRCHKNDCPPCNQKCGLQNTTSGCSHLCEFKCHTAVKTFKKSSSQTLSIWYNKEFEFKSLPHPKCEVKVMVTCIGGHRVEEWMCWNSTPKSCQRLCDRLLLCGFHKCSLICHLVGDISNMKEQEGCASCKEGCKIPRPLGCNHPCFRPCHSPPCNPCNAIVKTKCHCGLTQLVFKCAEYNCIKETTEQIIEIQKHKRSCGARCIKTYPCKHRCTSVCHGGECPNPELCRKKVRIFCKCKRIKIDVSCEKHRAGLQSINCNDICIITLDGAEKLIKHQDEERKVLENKKNQIELEQYEKLFAKKKYKVRKIIAEKQQDSVDCKEIAIYIGIVLAIIVAISVALFN